MKKTMTIGLVAMLAVGSAMAEDGMIMVNQSDLLGDSEVRSSAEVSLVSSHVWRGQVYNNDMVIQPQVTIAQYGLSINVWGNYDLGTNKDGTSSDFSEIDFSLGYTLPIAINELAFDVGLIGYHFPGNGTGGQGSPSTTELFAKATVLSFQDYVIPSMTLFGDIDEANGVYILFDVVAPYQISDVFAVEGGVSAGWGNTSYNDYYFGIPGTLDQDAGFNDYNFYANASYEIFENLTAIANVTYTFLEGGSLRDGADVIYEADNKLWGGVNLAYDF
jgi:outer membrane scaffolding protein for murein synthesis (MipA/OmpV family)